MAYLHSSLGRSYRPDWRFSRADSGCGFWCRRKYSFLRRRWRRRRDRLSDAEGEVARRKSGFCLMRSVNCCVALSGEWARERRVCAMWVFGAGEEAILCYIGSWCGFCIGFLFARARRDGRLGDGGIVECVVLEVGEKLFDVTSR